MAQGSSSSALSGMAGVLLLVVKCNKSSWIAVESCLGGGDPSDAETAFVRLSVVIRRTSVLFLYCFGLQQTQVMVKTTLAFNVG